jgi:hypothetical protein
MSTFYNTDGWGNKLVTIFARHLDSFILTNTFSLICQIRDFGSGQILHPGQLYLSPGLAKIAPWWLAHRDSFLAKVPGLVSADGATNVYSLNRRAVIKNTRKSEYIRLPALQVIKCILTRFLLTVYKFTPRHAITQPNTSADPQIKNWHSRHVLLIN